MDSQRLEVKAYLIAEYELFKQLVLPLLDLTQTDNNKEKNVLLAIIYTSPVQDSETNKEIQIYLALPKIS
ncbi:25007_t:CDS:1, partial [Racocetra persica]